MNSYSWLPGPKALLGTTAISSWSNPQDSHGSSNGRNRYDGQAEHGATIGQVIYLYTPAAVTFYTDSRQRGAACYVNCVMS